MNSDAAIKPSEWTLANVPKLYAKALGLKIDGEAYWKCVRELRRSGSRETFLIGKRLCNSHKIRDRKLGVDVLCQLRRYSDGVESRNPKSILKSKPVMRLASIRVIRPLLRDRRVGVLISTIYGLGHLSARERSKWLSPFSTHRNRDVRLAVARALGGQDDALALRTLAKLSKDTDSKTRDWATFGLGDMIEKDTPKIREALFERLHDRCREARDEAIVGLAKRKDERVIDLILRYLRKPNPRIYTLYAAEQFGHTIFYPVLKEQSRRRRGKVDPYWASSLQNAMKACRPRQRMKKASPFQSL
jgi:hypothetical protein